MKVVILAAGYGTRLYPLTRDIPKPLLSIAGKPMLNYIIDKIEEIKEIDEIIVVTNEKFYLKFKEWAGSLETNKQIIVLNDHTKSNKDRLGAIGDIHYAIKQKNIDDEMLVIAGDNLFDFDLKYFFNEFKKKSASIIALYDMKTKEAVTNKLGVVVLDDASKIIDFEEKPSEPKSTLAATFCYLFSKEDVKELETCIKEKNQPDNGGEFIKYLVNKKEVYGYVFKGAWFDIGDFEQYRKANEFYETDEGWIQL